MKSFKTYWKLNYKCTSTHKFSHLVGNFLSFNHNRNENIPKKNIVRSSFFGAFPRNEEFINIWYYNFRFDSEVWFVSEAFLSNQIHILYVQIIWNCLVFGVKFWPNIFFFQNFPHEISPRCTLLITKHQTFFLNF